MQLINENIDWIKTLCSKNKVERLYAFGSLTKGTFNEKSDIDLVVEIFGTDPLEYSDNYFNLKFSLEDTLGRKIDLLESKAIKNPYLLKEIEKTKVLIYG